MTIAMVVLLFLPYDVNKEVLMIFSSAYGSVMTYFFNRKIKEDKEDGGKEQDISGIY